MGVALTIHLWRDEYSRGPFSFINLNKILVVQQTRKKLDLGLFSLG